MMFDPQYYFDLEHIIDPEDVFENHAYHLLITENTGFFDYQERFDDDLFCIAKGTDLEKSDLLFPTEFNSVDSNKIPEVPQLPQLPLPFLTRPPIVPDSESLSTNTIDSVLYQSLLKAEIDSHSQYIAYVQEELEKLASFKPLQSALTCVPDIKIQTAIQDDNKKITPSATNFCVRKSKRKALEALRRDKTKIARRGNI